MKIFLNFAEKVFTILSLLLFSGAVLISLRRSMGVTDSQSDPLFQVIWFIIYGITFSLLALQWKGFTRLPSNINKPILLLTIFTALSYFWSAAPELTFRRSLALIGTTVFGIYFGTRYSQRQQLRLLAWTLGIAAVLSLIFALFLPAYGLDVHPFAGALRGVYTQKNLLARYMVLSALVFLLIALSSRKRRWIGWTGFVLSTIEIILSTSKTGLIVFLILLILLPLYRTLQWRYTKIIPIFITITLLIGCFAILITSEAETLLGLLGKDITLSGRTQLWDAVFTMIQQRPWLGYGYNAFWLGLGGYSAYVWEVVNWPAPHSHNGILDLWLDLGIIGVVLFTLSFLSALFKAFTQVRQSKNWEDFWPILYLTVMVLFNLTQSSILAQNNLVWILFIATTIANPVQFYRSKRNFPSATLNKLL